MCLFIMFQNHLILHLILLTQPEVTQCYEIVTHYPFRLYNSWVSGSDYLGPFASGICTLVSSVSPSLPYGHLQVPV